MQNVPIFNRTIYFSNGKQFTVKPEWIWHLTDFKLQNYIRNSVKINSHGIVSFRCYFKFLETSGKFSNNTLIKFRVNS